MVRSGLVFATGFPSSVNGIEHSFCSVTEEYGWRLRKGLVSLGLVALGLLRGPGVEDTFLACFFFFLLF